MKRQDGNKNAIPDATKAKAWSKRIKGGLLFGWGYLLSPLSWWNDAVINVPLAWLLASLVGCLWPTAFEEAFIGAYWLTNLAGFIFMSVGGRNLLGGRFSHRKWLIIILTTVVYTLGIVLLLRGRIVGPFWIHF